MSFFSSKPQSNEPVAIIDISGSAVSGLLISDEEIGLTVSEEINIGEQVDLKQFILAVSQAIEKVAGKLRQESKIVPKAYLCFLSAPFYFSQTKRFVFRQKEPFVVTKKLVAKLISEEKQKIINNHKHLFANLAGDEAQAVESNILDWHLNGYSYPAPWGLETKELAFSYHLGLGSKEILSQMTSRLQKAGWAIPVVYQTFTQVASALIKRNKLAEHYILFDLDGDLTDLALVTDGVLSETISFPRGKNFILRRLAGITGAIPSEAKTSVKLFYERKLETKQMEQIGNFLAQARDEWVGDLAELFKQLSEEYFLPSQIYLVGEPLLNRFFQEALGDAQLSRFLLGGQIFKIESLEKVLLPNSPSALTKNLCPFLQVEALFYRSKMWYNSESW